VAFWNQKKTNLRLFVATFSKGRRGEKGEGKKKKREKKISKQLREREENDSSVQDLLTKKGAKELEN